jgi:hypothetical protein
MLKKLHSSLSNTLWLFVPTLLWSLVFHGLVLCIDPLLLQALDGRVRRGIAVALRSAWAVMFGVALLYAWNITPPTYSFYLHEALPFCPPSVLASMLVAVLALSWFSTSRTTARLPRALSLTLVGAAFVLLAFKLAVVAVAGQPAALQKRIKSQVVTVGRMGWATLFRPPPSTVRGTPQVTFNGFMRGQPELPAKLILMVVESWGERPAELERIAAEIAGARVRVVGSGFTTYRGATLSGEFRELCSQYVAPTDVLKKGQAGIDCAPGRLAGKGYKAIGLHGYQKGFYARATFWQRFGIPEGIFREELTGMEQCVGPFEGVCDESLVRRGVELLGRDEGKRLVYMLTLSSHEPLDRRVLARPPGRYFGDVKVVHPTQLVTRRAISALLSELTSRADQPCTMAYVVGDHQPPSASATRDVFVENKVPFLAFKYNCPS